jgi:hypothetical protein
MSDTVQWHWVGVLTERKEQPSTEKDRRNPFLSPSIRAGHLIVSEGQDQDVPLRIVHPSNSRTRIPEIVSQGHRGA